jgi:hypothetical protein
MKKVLFYSIQFLSLSLFAQVASFDESELRQHDAQIHQIAAVSADCLDWYYQDHLNFYSQWGISKYYGDRRADYATKEGLLAALQFYNKPAELVTQLEPISCIGLAMKCLQRGFEAVGMAATWQKIYAELAKERKFYGTDLQKNLIRLGWKSYYWNPDPSQNTDWDIEDKKLTPLEPGREWMPVWGGHEYRYKNHVLKGFYFERDLIVHDAVSLVGYKDVQPAFFKDIPFFVGIAHAGYHVFPGRNGEVIEAHSKRDLDKIDNLEFSEFNPLKKGGGPRWTHTERYRSGIVVTPNF